MFCKLKMYLLSTCAEYIDYAALALALVSLLLQVKIGAEAEAYYTHVCMYKSMKL